MRKLETGEIAITGQEADAIYDFIRYQLDRSWDRYTDNVICPGVKWEEGMRRMDPKMYDFAEELLKINLV